MDNPIKGDPFWESNAKLPIGEIDKRFDPRTAAALKVTKEQMEK